MGRHVYLRQINIVIALMLAVRPDIKMKQSIIMYINYTALPTKVTEYSHNDCFTGLRLIHEISARKGQTNVLRVNFESASMTQGFDCSNDFLVDAAPGYIVHVGARNSSHNLQRCKYEHSKLNNCFP